MKRSDLVDMISAPTPQSGFEYCVVKADGAPEELLKKIKPKVKDGWRLISTSATAKTECTGWIEHTWFGFMGRKSNG